MSLFKVPGDGSRIWTYYSSIVKNPYIFLYIFIYIFICIYINIYIKYEVQMMYYNHCFKSFKLHDLFDNQKYKINICFNILFFTIT